MIATGVITRRSPWVSSVMVVLVLAAASAWIPTSEGDCLPRLGCSRALAYYKLVNDDTLLALADRFMTNVAELQKYNDIPNPDSVEAGTVLFFPYTCECIDDRLGHEFLYQVALDDTVAQIAQIKYQFLSREAWITQASKLSSVGTIYPGLTVTVPVNCSCGDPSVSPDYGLFLTYPIRSGDNFTGIAQQFQANETLLQQYNPSINWSNLSPSTDIIFIPQRVFATGAYPAFNFSADVSEGGSKTNAGLIAGVSVGGALALVLAVVLFFLFCVYWPRQRHSDPSNKAAMESLRLDGSQSGDRRSALLKFSQEGAGHSRSSTGSGIPVGPIPLTDFTVDKSVEFSFEELEAATNKFSAANKIGEGGYGAVYFANLRGMKLAVKRMNLQATREFLAELQVLTHVHHTNLVQLIGYCTVDSLFLIYEYVDNGTLDRHLHGKNDLAPLSWSSRVQIALDAARGLEYIHEHTKPTYIHRDVKSSNILIDKQFHAKVADFGLTKLTESGVGSFSLTVPTRLVGTFGYMSPEYARFGDVSPKVDVYSFGVVLFEIISAKEAIVRISGTSADGAGQHKEEQRGLVTLFDEIVSDPDGKEKLRRLVDPALGDNYPLESAWKMAQLAGACTKENPELRPSMRTAVVALMTLSSTTQDWEMHAYGSERITPGLISGR
ncbi:chitin elicitor receptor kinase 1 [Marchantia polymorpha subsp. ruderalis]|uniref:Uncharacterized protein n=2 Tax=Marchantia polymorpha TaxID=3197 RepID=A0A176VGD1_MARPO|nr:hypothetical protein AXG93_1520s1430 [Marchantia polymorpha subsp. ruderalis]PTQ34435.1 hypothetical protein MARPO_0080s0051 [Marchantia polymorpha]BBN07269.1 hypothetical protein Mp_4g02480 [Marchantia polymorpha subsp. ruderalis]|eukprot:PTQ34435.1 hypothetical protein MARPO_0080s0051 [Marchantia polymorpha]